MAARLVMLGAGGGLGAVGVSAMRQGQPQISAPASRAIDTAVTAVTVGAVAVDAASVAKRSGQAVGAGLARARRVADGSGRAAKAAAQVTRLANGRFAQAAAQAVNSKSLALVSRVALPLLAARGVYNAVQGYQRGGVQGAAVGLADTVLAGRVSAAIDGYRANGLAGAVDGATFHAAGLTKGAAPPTVAEMRPKSNAPVVHAAYLNAGAATRAQAAQTTGASRPVATLQASDGMTAGYQRVDPRSGRTVTVKGYQTPGKT